MKIMEMAEIVFSMNITEIEKTISNSFIDNVPSEYMEFKVFIDLIALCDTSPVLVHKMVRSFLPFKESLRILIEQEIKKKYKEKEIEYAQLINFKDLFDVLIEVSNVPILAFDPKIRYTMKILQPKYNLIIKDTNIFNGESIRECVSDVKVPLSTFKGTVSGKVVNLEKKSSFYLCANKNCHDKTYFLNLKNISYNFMDSKRSFTFGTSSSTNSCFNCKTQLVELMKKRKIKKSYSYMLTDTKFHLKCESEIDLECESGLALFNESSDMKVFYLTGNLSRKTNGSVFFTFFSRCYVKEKEEFKSRIAQVAISTKKNITDDLLLITSIYFYDFKSLCSEEDILLFIILNIVNLTNKKILLFTSDPVYAFRCCQNILIENKNKKISFDLKSLKESPGICIRGYNEEVNKKIRVDYIFNLSISSFLDYKYTSPDKEEVEINFRHVHSNGIFEHTIYSSQVEPCSSFNQLFSDYKSIQLLFLDFRESYKGKIEPERLFDTLLSLYNSIKDIMKGEKDELYADFILKHFKDKLL